MLFSLGLSGQSALNGTWVLAGLDSMRSGQSRAALFAGLYYRTTARALAFYANDDTVIQTRMDRFEFSFYRIFLDAARASREADSIPIVWQTYFLDTAPGRLRGLLLGINAHINGDIWKALTSSFSRIEIARLTPDYRRFNQSLLMEFDSLYRYAISQNRRLKTFHLLSLGLDRYLGRRMLMRWRNRQLAISRLYFDSPGRFRKSLLRIQHKKARIDRRILSQI